MGCVLQWAINAFKVPSTVLGTQWTLHKCWLLVLFPQLEPSALGRLIFSLPLQSLAIFSPAITLFLSFFSFEECLLCWHSSVCLRRVKSYTFTNLITDYSYSQTLLFVDSLCILSVSFIVVLSHTLHWALSILCFQNKTQRSIRSRAL